jgi:hypothetical protein
MTKNLLYCMGDLQLSDLQDYRLELSNRLLDWFEALEVPEGAELIFGGDLTERPQNAGIITNLVARFGKACSRKFAHTYLIQGNHDRSIIHLKEQLAFEFLNIFDNITLLKRETMFTTPNGFECIALPYQRMADRSLDDYYTNDLPSGFYTTEADVLVAHTARKEKGSYFGGVDFGKFATHNLALAHIHTRRGEYAADYCGSWAPLKVDEYLPSDLDREFKCYTKEGSNRAVYSPELSIHPPRVISFDSLMVTDKAPTHTDGLIHVYLVKGCNSLQKAREAFPHEYIRAVEANKATSASVASVAADALLFKSKIEAFTTMVKEMDMKLKRSTHAYIQQILSQS